MAADDEIIIPVDLDISDAESTLVSLRKKFEQLQGTEIKLTGDFDLDLKAISAAKKSIQDELSKRTSYETLLGTGDSETTADLQQQLASLESIEAEVRARMAADTQALSAQMLEVTMESARLEQSIAGVTTAQQEEAEAAKVTADEAERAAEAREQEATAAERVANADSSDSADGSSAMSAMQSKAKSILSSMLMSMQRMAHPEASVPIEVDTTDIDGAMATLSAKINEMKGRLKVNLGIKEDVLAELEEAKAAADKAELDLTVAEFSSKPSENIEQLQAQFDTLKQKEQELAAQLQSTNGEYITMSQELDRMVQEYAQLVEKAETLKSTSQGTESTTDQSGADAAVSTLGDRIKSILMSIAVGLDKVAKPDKYASAQESVDPYKIPVELDEADVERQLASLEKRYKTLQQRLQIKTNLRDELTAELERANSELIEFETTIGNGGVLPGSQAYAQWQSISRYVEEVKRQLDACSASIGNISAESMAVQNVFASLKQSTEQVRSKWEQVVNYFKASSIKSVLSDIGSGMANIAKKAVSTGKQIATSLGKKAISGVKTLAKGIANCAKNFFSLKSGASGVKKGFSDGLPKLLAYGFGIRTLFSLFTKLRSALTDSMGILAKHSAQTNSDLSTLSSGLATLKNAAATAAAPILTAITPALSKLINMATAAATAIARLTAMLTGKSTFVKAEAVQKDYAASLDKTSGSASNAAKEAKKTLAAFDEINQLNGDTDSSGGGGGGSSAGDEGTFTTEQIEPLNFNSWGEAFSAMLDKIINDGIPKLKSALTSLAQWINSFAANTAEMFTFPGVYDKIVLIAQEVANAFNDFVNMIDWGTIGTAIGAGLNLLIALLANLIYTFDWYNLGSSIATAINNAIAQIDWYATGQLLASKFMIAINSLAGFLLTLDMTQLAQSASQFAIGFFNSISSALEGIDWQALGQQVATFLTNVDWSGVATACAEAIGAAFGAVAGFLWGLIEDAWQQVIDWWYEHAVEDGHFTFAGLLEGIGEAIYGIYSWIKTNIFDPFINAFKKAFGIGSPSKKMKEQGGYIMDGLKEGIISKITAVIGTFSGLWSKIKEVFGNVRDWFSEKFSSAWQAVKDVFSKGGEVFDGIKDGILDGLKAVINVIINGINKVIAVPFNGLNSAMRTLRGISILGLKPFSWIKTFTVPQIPKLAQGAVIPPNREFMAVLGDQKSGTNIETPLSTMVQAFKQALSESGSANGDIYVYLDSNQIAARVEHRQRQRSIRTNGAY